MKYLHWFMFIEAFALLVGLPPAWSESTSAMKAKDNFKVNWSSVTYSKTLQNSEASPSMQISKDSETLSLICGVEILDPNLVLGVCWNPIIEEITNGKGVNIDSALVSSGSRRMQYEPLQYKYRTVYLPRKFQWATKIQAIFGLPPMSSRRRIKKLKPWRMDIQLNLGLHEGGDRTIGYAKGHFRALVAESLEYVEIPFKLGEDWVRLTPALEIKLFDTECTEKDFGFRIRRRPHDATSIRTMSFQDYFPNRIVVARELIVKDDKRSQHPLGIQRLPADILQGLHARGSSDCLIKSIRFMIAVRPKHHKIPFVLEKIPSPIP